MKAKDYVKFLLPEEVYLIFMVMYLINLDKLNKILLSQYKNNSISLLLYNGGKPIKYFCIALFLFLAGCYIIFKRFNRIRFEDLDFGEIIASIIALLFMLFLLVLLWVFIKNPILRMIFTAIMVGASAIYTYLN